MMVQVTSVDRQANTITVTDSATMSPRTLTVDTAAQTQLADLEAGDQVTITCSGTATDTTSGTTVDAKASVTVTIADAHQTTLRANEA